MPEAGEASLINFTDEGFLYCSGMDGKGIINEINFKSLVKDITDQCSFVNEWKSYGSTTRIKIIPGYVVVTGLVYAGLTAANTKILHIPDSVVQLDPSCMYVYGSLKALSSSTSASILMPFRSYYLQIDNNVILTPFEQGDLVSIFAMLPLK